MWFLIAIVIWLAFMYYWVAFCLTVSSWLFAIGYAISGKFIRASIYLCIGWGMLLWWISDDPRMETSFNDWLQGSAVLVGFVMALVLLWKWYRYQKRRESIPDFGTLPAITGNVVPFVKATREERERVMKIQNYKCANPYCNQDLRDSVPHWDHIVPRSAGGTDSVHNMQWLCDTCNMNKGDRDWLQFLFGYATGMGMDPNKNQEPWKRWVLTRANNGLQCQG
jgi:hypothetical protein